MSSQGARLHALRAADVTTDRIRARRSASDATSPEDRVLSTERAGHIAEAIEKLPDRQRAVFTMCHVADQTTSEVSQALGLSEATVRVHLFRAVRKLRKLLA